MAASFEKVFDMMGFDKAAAPRRWQMVPVNGDRYIALRDGADLTVTSNDPRTLTVTETSLAQIPRSFGYGSPQPLHATDRVLKLTGVAHGGARVLAKRGATTVVELEVDVKNKLTVRTSFNFVRDTGGHRTNRAAASAQSWVNSMNYVYNGQANVFITLLHARSITVQQDLGPQVMWTATAPNEWDTVTALGDTGADMNYFLVWEYEQDNTPTVDDTDAGTVGSNCIFEDNAGREVGVSMAHEMGHHLGRPDIYNSAQMHFLMYGITDQRGVHLAKEDVNVMNP